MVPKVAYDTLGAIDKTYQKIVKSYLFIISTLWKIIYGLQGIR